MEIQLKERKEVLRIGIRDEEGKNTGNYLEFDFGDISLPLKFQQLLDEYKKNRMYVKNQFIIIDKKQDHKGKKLMSSNEEEKIKVLNEYYKKQMASYNLFLGENGCEKILNGKKPYWNMFEDINSYIEPLMPVFEEKIKEMENEIISKYKNNNESDVLE